MIERDNAFRREMHLGNKKGLFSQKWKTTLIGKMLEWLCAVPAFDPAKCR